MANETLQKGKAAVEQSVRTFEQSYSAMVEKMRDYNLKMIDMAEANTVVEVFEFARQLRSQRARDRRGDERTDPGRCGAASISRPSRLGAYRRLIRRVCAT